MKNNIKRAIFCAALGNIIWGFSFLFTKVGLTVVSDPYIMLAHRFIISSVIMLFPMLMGKTKLSFKGKKWGSVLLLLATQLCYYLFEGYSILYTNSTIAGLVLAVVPVVTIGTGALFLKEYPTKRQTLFCIMPIVGVILITISSKELGVISPIGGLFLLLTLLSSAIYKTANRKASENFTPYERTFMVLSISAVVFTVIGLRAVKWDIAAFTAPLVHIKYLVAVLSLSLLCSIVANLLVNYAMDHMLTFKVSSFGSLSTLCAALAGIIFLKEPFNISLVLGGALILVGVHQITKAK